MFGEYKTLYPSPNYKYDCQRAWLCHGLGPFSQYHASLIIDVILDERALRSTVQRIDTLNDKIRAAQKLPSDNSEFDKLEEEWERLKKARANQMQKLYEDECFLGMGSLRKGYNSVKSNPAWYLREEPVEDCIGRGGCCSRQCG
jgi:hypothetical protein